MGRVVAHPQKLEPEIVYEIIGGDGNLGFAASLRAIFAHDLRDELENLSVSTLLIWGNRDGVIGYGDLFRFGRKIPDAKTILLDDTGHVAMVEHPEWFDRTASEFLLSER
jgi:pimeloyl-ACP methyl ester carboxylesterase